MDIYAAISNTSFFRELAEESRRELSKVSIHRHVKKKEVMFVEGDEGHSVYLLLDGAVQLSKMAPDGSERVIKVVQPGEVFAEVVLFEVPNYPVTATVLVDSLILLIPKKAFHEMLSHEAFRNDFITALLRKQRYLTDKVYSLSALDVEARFFAFLKEHYGDSKNISLAISKKDVAAAIGTVPETLSRLVQKLEQEGRLQWKGKRIEIL